VSAIRIARARLVCVELIFWLRHRCKRCRFIGVILAAALIFLPDPGDFSPSECTLPEPAYRAVHHLSAAPIIQPRIITRSYYTKLHRYGQLQPKIRLEARVVAAVNDNELGLMLGLASGISIPSAGEIPEDSPANQNAFRRV
jgi:hypothetical protein